MNASDDMSNERNPGCLGYIGYYTAQLCRDDNKPLRGSLLNNQDSMESKARFFFRGSHVWGPLTYVDGCKTLGPLPLIILMGIQKNEQ